MHKHALKKYCKFHSHKEHRLRLHVVYITSYQKVSYVLYTNVENSQA